jgi:hypothetical protein
MGRRGALLAVCIVVLVCGCDEFDNSKVAAALEKAVDANDASKCGELSASADKDLCYQLAALALRQPSACGSVGNKTMGDQCYSRLAQVQSEYSLCWNVRDSQGKALCMTMVSATKAQNTADGIQGVLNGAEPAVGEATYVKGDVLYQPAGGKEWKAVSQDTKFKVGDVVRVGPNSKFRYIEGVGTEQAHMKVVPAGQEVTMQKPEEPPKRSLTETVGDLIQSLTKSEKEDEVALGGR